MQPFSPLLVRRSYCVLSIVAIAGVANFAAAIVEQSLLPLFLLYAVVIDAVIGVVFYVVVSGVAVLLVLLLILYPF